MAFDVITAYMHVVISRCCLDRSFLGIYMPLSPSNETRRHGSCYSPSGIFPYEGLYLLSVGRGLVIRRAEYYRKKISTYTTVCRTQILEASHFAEAAVVVVTVVVHTMVYL